jgi:hypothetical protein
MPAFEESEQGTRRASLFRLVLCTPDVEQDERVDARDRALVAADAARVLDHVLALAVGGEPLHAELLRQRPQVVLSGTGPLPPDLDHLPAPMS